MPDSIPLGGQPQQPAEKEDPKIREKAVAALQGAEDDIRKRLASIPDGWRDPLVRNIRSTLSYMAEQLKVQER